jgi:hypothetical protein
MYLLNKAFNNLLYLSLQKHSENEIGNQGDKKQQFKNEYYIFIENSLKKLKSLKA